MPCETPIDCDVKNITPIEILRKVSKIDSNGCLAINTVAVIGDASDDFISCDNTHLLSYREIVLSMITTDSDGNWAVRVIESTL